MESPDPTKIWGEAKEKDWLFDQFKEEVRNGYVRNNPFVALWLYEAMTGLYEDKDDVWGTTDFRACIYTLLEAVKALIAINALPVIGEAAYSIAREDIQGVAEAQRELVRWRSSENEPAVACFETVLKGTVINPAARGPVTIAFAKLLMMSRLEARADKCAKSARG